MNRRNQITAEMRVRTGMMWSGTLSILGALFLFEIFAPAAFVLFVLGILQQSTATKP